MPTEAEFGLLRRADGSASFSINGYSVIAGVNGPVEVQRRDELPEEATIEVNIRPAVGVPGVRERHFESLLHKVLRSVIKVAAHPRTLIQVTLQVTETPEDAYSIGRLPQAASNLSILPPLMNAAALALLTTSIPLETTLSSTVLAILPSREIALNPTPHAIARAISIHVFAFAANGKLLMVESEGDFDTKQWLEVAKQATHACLGVQSEAETNTSGGEVAMQDSDVATNLAGVLRKKMEEKITEDNKWKKATK